MNIRIGIIPAMLLAGMVAAGAREVMVREQRLGVMPPEYRGMTRDELTTSEDGLHLALVTRHGDKWVMVRDGKEGRAYDQILNELTVFSPDGSHSEYVARKGGKFVMVVDGREGPRYDSILVKGPPFSANGRHVAYMAQLGSKQLVVTDGKAGPEFDLICNGWVNFSSDGNHYGYVARKGGKFVAVVDGRQTMDFEGRELQGTVFSADGRHVCYLAQKDVKWVMVIDGKAGPEFDHVYVPFFSTDGRHSAYTGQNSNRFAMVVDGKAGPEYAQMLTASPFTGADGNQVVYWAAKCKEPAVWPDNTSYVMVINGVEGPEHDGLGPPVFSPDGKRLAYMVQYGKSDMMERSKGIAKPWTTKQSIVLDGVEGPKYDGIISGPMYSPDSRHLAYLVQKFPPQAKPRYSVVLDGKEGPEYERINDFPSSVVWSSDSRQLGYVAWKWSKRLVVVDEQEGPEYDSGGMELGTLWHMYSLGFSRDGKHAAYYAQKGAKWVVVVDGAEGPEYDDVLRSRAYGAAPAFRDDGAVEYLTVKGNVLYRVVEKF